MKLDEREVKVAGVVAGMIEDAAPDATHYDLPVPVGLLSRQTDVSRLLWLVFIGAGVVGVVSVLVAVGGAF